MIFLLGSKTVRLARGRHTPTVPGGIVYEVRSESALHVLFLGSKEKRMRCQCGALSRLSAGLIITPSFGRVIHNIGGVGKCMG